MTTKIRTTVLLLLIISIVYLACTSNAQVQDSFIINPIAIPSVDSTIKKVVDSTKVIRDEFVAQKECLRDKVDFLQCQQKKIEESQKQIDSIIYP